MKDFRTMWDEFNCSAVLYGASPEEQESRQIDMQTFVDMNELQKVRVTVTVGNTPYSTDILVKEFVNKMASFLAELHQGAWKLVHQGEEDLRMTQAELRKRK